MWKKKRRWSRNLAKLVIGSRNAWVIELLVFKSQIVWAHRLVSLYLGSLVGRPTWKGKGPPIAADRRLHFEKIIHNVRSLINILAGWWSHKLLVIPLAWSIWEAEGCSRLILNMQSLKTWMYGGRSIPFPSFILWHLVYLVNDIFFTLHFRLHSRVALMMKMLWELSISCMMQLWFLVATPWVNLSLYSYCTYGTALGAINHWTRVPVHVLECDPVKSHIKMKKGCKTNKTWL